MGYLQGPNTRATFRSVKRPRRRKRYGHGLLRQTREVWRMIRHPIREWREIKTDLRLADEDKWDELDERLRVRFGDKR